MNLNKYSQSDVILLQWPTCPPWLRPCLTVYTLLFCMGAICCKMWGDSLFWNQYITKTNEKNVGGHGILYYHCGEDASPASPT